MLVANGVIARGDMYSSAVVHAHDAKFSIPECCECEVDVEGRLEGVRVAECV